MTLPRQDGRKDTVLPPKRMGERPSSAIIRWLVPSIHSPVPHKRLSSTNNSRSRKSSRISLSSGWSKRRSKAKAQEDKQDHSLVAKLQQELREARDQVTALQQRDADISQNTAAGAPNDSSHTESYERCHHPQHEPDVESGSIPRTVTIDKSEAVAFPSTGATAVTPTAESQNDEEQQMSVESVKPTCQDRTPETTASHIPLGSGIGQVEPTEVVESPPQRDSQNNSDHRKRSQAQDPATPSTRTSATSWNSSPTKVIAIKKSIVSSDQKSGEGTLIDQDRDQETDASHQLSGPIMEKDAGGEVSESPPQRLGSHLQLIPITPPGKTSSTTRDTPPTEVLTIRKTSVVPTVEVDPRFQRQLAKAMLMAETYRSKLGKAETRISNIFRDLEEARRSVHTLAARNITLATKLKTTKLEREENMVHRTSVLKAFLYMSPVFVICGGWEYFLLTIVLLWMLLELEAAKALKQVEEEETAIQPIEKPPKRNAFFASIPEMIELTSQAPPESVLTDHRL